MRMTFLVLLTACGTASTIDDSGAPSELVCPGGGLDILPVNETELPTCADTETRYTDVVEAFRFCTVPADCQVLNGGCGEGIGGCYEFVNTCLDQAVLNEISNHFATLDGGSCVQGVCDCDVAPPVDCVAERCEAVD